MEIFSAQCIFNFENFWKSKIYNHFLLTHLPYLPVSGAYHLRCCIREAKTPIILRKSNVNPLTKGNPEYKVQLLHYSTVLYDKEVLPYNANDKELLLIW